MSFGDYMDTTGMEETMSTVGENDDPSDCSSPRTSSDEDDEEAILLTWKQGLWMILKVLTLHHWPHKWNFSFWDEIYTTMNLLWDELWPSQEKNGKWQSTAVMTLGRNTNLFVRVSRGHYALKCLVNQYVVTKRGTSVTRFSPVDWSKQKVLDIVPPYATRRKAFPGYSLERKLIDTFAAVTKPSSWQSRRKRPLESFPNLRDRTTLACSIGSRDKVPMFPHYCRIEPMQMTSYNGQEEEVKDVPIENDEEETVDWKMPTKTELATGASPDTSPLVGGPFNALTVNNSTFFPEEPICQQTTKPLSVCHSTVNEKDNPMAIRFLLAPDTPLKLNNLAKVCSDIWQLPDFY